MGGRRRGYRRASDGWMVPAWTGLDILVRTCSAFEAVLAFKGFGCLVLLGDGNFGDREHVGAGGADCGKTHG